MTPRARSVTRHHTSSVQGVGGAPADRRWERFLPLLIVGLGLAAYWNSFSGVFLFDDERYILRNPRIQRLWPPFDILSSGRPVADLTFAVNYAVGKTNVWGYHAVNLSIHILAGLTLFGILRRTLLRESNEPHPTAEARWLALVIALLWVLHPLQTQSVTYITQRCESLMGLFYLLTVYCVIRGSEGTPYSAHSGTLFRTLFGMLISVLRSYGWYAAAVCCGALAMGTKAVAVTAPVVVYVYDVVFMAKSWRKALRLRWGLYLCLGVTWLVLWQCRIVPGVLNPSAEAATVGFGYKGITPVEYLMTQPGVILHYLKLSFWSHPLCLDYGWPVARSLCDIVPPMIAIGLLLGGTAWALLRRSWLGFAGVWFFIILAPTSSFIPVKDAMFEHRMYLSLAGVVAPAVIIARTGLARGAMSLGWGQQACRWIAGSVAVLVIASLTYGTVRRNEAYQSDLTMWSEVAAQRPGHARAHDSLGTAYHVRAQYAQAVEQYHEALRLDPTSADAHFNLATTLIAQGQADEGIKEFKEAIGLNSRHVIARISLGNALASQGKMEAAIAEYRSAIEIHPQAAAAHLNMGNALAALGRTDEAIDAYEAAVSVAPTYADAYYNLGNMFARKGQTADAVRAFRNAVRVNPEHYQAHFKLGTALLQQGRRDQATVEFREVLRIRPDHQQAREALRAAGG